MQDTCDREYQQAKLCSGKRRLTQLAEQTEPSEKSRAHSLLANPS